MLGRIVHYSADLILFSTLLAGMKRSSGLSPDLDRITSDTARNFADKYIGIGEFVFDSSMAAAHASQFFKRTGANSNAQVPYPLADMAKEAQKNRPNNSWWS